MKKIDTIQSVGILSRAAEEKFNIGDPLILDVAGRPALRVRLLDPLMMDQYGRYRNRGPQIAGSFALKCFLTASDSVSRNAVVYPVVEVVNQLYGFILNDSDVLNGIATQLGYGEEFNFSVYQSAS